VSLKYSKAAVELGKRLVAQLDTGDDLLASWMAHDVAERITLAEQAPDEHKAAARESCAAAISTLWHYRAALPPHLKPLGKLEPVLRTLASLDTDRTKHRYFPQALQEAATADADGTIKEQIDLAVSLDYTARQLVQFALRTAADDAATDAAPWVKLAREAGADTSPEEFVVEWVLQGKPRTSDDERYKADLRRKIEKIEGFIESAKAMIISLRAQTND